MAETRMRAERRDPSFSSARRDAPPTGADALVQQARRAPLTDGGLATAALLSEALDHDPCHHEAQILLDRLYRMTVPRWHFPMLGDRTRNEAYARAIAATVQPGDVVLDIGCGAGLTAMLAARAGAKHVYTCEQQPLIARAAEEVIARNGLSDRITVIPKLSHRLVVGIDLPEPADVVISEIVDTVLLGEGALATLVHAMRRLARPGARAIPEQGLLRAQAVQSEPLSDLWRPAEALGFDLGAFHGFARTAQLTPSDFACSAMTALGPATDLFRFDFRNPGLRPGDATRDLVCTQAGRAHAVLVSFELDLGAGNRLGNGLDARGHWGRTAYLTDDPVAVQAGDALRITARHDSEQLSLAIHADPPGGSAAGSTGPVAIDATVIRPF